MQNLLGELRKKFPKQDETPRISQRRDHRDSRQ
jgi:hypothetical protein